MDIGFKIWTILKTVNTRPKKGREDTRRSGMKSGMLLSAALFLAACVYGVGQERAGSSVYLFLAFACAAGGLLGTRLLRSETVSAVYTAVLALMTAAAAVYGGITAVMWALFFPLMSIGICGIKFGALISGALTVFFGVLFYALAPAAYPPEVLALYPIVYSVTWGGSCVYSYFQHKQLLNRQNNEEALEKAVKAEHDRVMVMTTQTILSISNAVDARDTYTQRHSARVAEYAAMLAKTLDWDAGRLEQLYSIALLHDIGKIGISDAILNKHAALTPEEREIIKQHTVIGGEILKDLTLLPNACIGAVSHHERYDGTGYPYGLKGAQIPLEARIIGIADSFDAMNSSRVYRGRMAPEKILQELRNGRGSQFDPELLDKFLPIAEQILQADEL